MATQLSYAGPERAISFEEFLRTYDGVHAEWVDGSVFVMSPGSKRHSKLTRFLSGILQHWAEEKGLGEVFVPAFPMRLADRPSGREPDVFFVSAEHEDRLGDRFFDGAADLVIEIVSPESRMRDRGEKLAEYQRGGAREYWIVDPDQKRVDAYRLGEEGRFVPMALGDPPVLRGTVLPGMWVDVAWLWLEPLPTMNAVQKVWGLI